MALACVCRVEQVDDKLPSEEFLQIATFTWTHLLLRLLLSHGTLNRHLLVIQVFTIIDALGV